MILKLMYINKKNKMIKLEYLLNNFSEPWGKFTSECEELVKNIVSSQIDLNLKEDNEAKEVSNNSRILGKSRRKNLLLHSNYQNKSKIK